MTSSRDTDHTSRRPSNREIYEASYSGAQNRPFIPRLRSDNYHYHPLPHNLVEFRTQEGESRREQRLRDVWSRLPKKFNHDDAEDEEIARRNPVKKDGVLTKESAKELEEMYQDELVGRCGGHTSGFRRRSIGWNEFREYAVQKEAELWRIFHDELDMDGNGHLDAEELAVALDKAGIVMTPATLTEFMTTMTSTPHSHAISFEEFRDFLLLMPRKASAAEIFRYYEVKKFMGDDGRGAARVNMEGDVSLSAEDLSPNRRSLLPKEATVPLVDHPEMEDEDDHDEYSESGHEEETQSVLGGSLAVKFLLAGGVAGADLGGTIISAAAPTKGMKAIAGAVARIYAEGGVLAFWTGNGLSVAKILPESAIKFMSYESSKRFFAKYWDKVEDSRDISGVSRFLSGGIGGLTSIYPIETLKTQMMSGTERRTLLNAARRLWGLGGLRACYRGLGIGLIGVFPYSAIDMSTFEALKLAYLRSTGKEEPGVWALLAFGSVSGSVGATSVYPLNLVRTRLQASGSDGHPMRYTGVFDVVQQTWGRDGWRGFYRGLAPTLAKVVPAVSISYVVYESSKRKLGV
ncbi:hypothetical protein EUX98_g1280 [Antrodiella citrinella]|uniref:EF-hand domain-containing protein n=1 Tax=Antrodiella citrinella TaxID=2447956 RepID=A0A4S4N3E7_9APHY|nr:hypothetical protein EUX98_g1280 [Antrodiella citrinella]